MLELKQLTKVYGDTTVVKSLDLQLKRGEVFGFVGANGAGKTTTMKMIAGLIEPTSGSITLNGNDFLGERSLLNKMIGYMPDFFGVYDNLKVMEYMEFYASLYGIYGKEAKTKIFELLELVQLKEKENDYVDYLSRGMKQRLCLARSLVHDPQILILDEPASGLDPGARIELKEIIKSLKALDKTIMISSHILLELSQICTTVGIMKQGEMVLVGEMDEVLTKSKERSLLKIMTYTGREKAIEILKSEKRVESISIFDECFHVKFSGDEEAEAHLLKKLIQEDVLVSSFSKEKYDLEDIFIEITQKGVKLDENESHFT